MVERIGKILLCRVFHHNHAVARIGGNSDVVVVELGVCVEHGSNRQRCQRWAGVDTIALEHDIFKFGTVGKTIGAAAFTKGTSGTAQDGSDRIIYETDTGKLFFDKNGNASGGAIQIALLDKNLALTEKDFLIV